MAISNRHLKILYFESDRSAVGRLRRRAFGGKKEPKTFFYVQKNKNLTRKGGGVWSRIGHTFDAAFFF